MAILTTRVIEDKLRLYCERVRLECDGALPPDTGLALAVEEIGHALGLDDAALKRILELEVLPSQERPVLWPSEFAISLETDPDRRAQLQSWRDAGVSGELRQRVETALRNGKQLNRPN